MFSSRALSHTIFVSLNHMVGSQLRELRIVSIFPLTFITLDLVFLQYIVSRKIWWNWFWLIRVRTANAHYVKDYQFLYHFDERNFTFQCDKSSEENIKLKKKYTNLWKINSKAIPNQIKINSIFLSRCNENNMAIKINEDKNGKRNKMKRKKGKKINRLVRQICTKSTE